MYVFKLYIDGYDELSNCTHVHLILYVYALGVASACLFDVSVRIPERFLKSPELFLKT